MTNLVDLLSVKKYYRLKIMCGRTDFLTVSDTKFIFQTNNSFNAIKTGF